MTNLEKSKKDKDISVKTKIRVSQAVVSLVVTYNWKIVFQGKAREIR